VRPEPNRDAGPTRRLVIAGGVAASLSACAEREPVTLPVASLPGLPGLTLNGWPVPGVDGRNFLGRVSLLNVWASWCPYCRGEHDTLMRLSADGRFPLIGLVWQDKAEPAVAYLRRAGNPFRAVALDTGAFARPLGQRGVPSTYVVDKAARVVASVRGGIGDDEVRDRLMPAILRARAT
jgi:cytochrome c biogenesis protein CcmG, thiol:disulfide interchange protein DsbE